MKKLTLRQRAYRSWVRFNRRCNFCYQEVGTYKAGWFAGRRSIQRDERKKERKHLAKLDERAIHFRH